MSGLRLVCTLGSRDPRWPSGHPVGETAVAVLLALPGPSVPLAGSRAGPQAQTRSVPHAASPKSPRRCWDLHVMLVLTAAPCRGGVFSLDLPALLASAQGPSLHPGAQAPRLIGPWALGLTEGALVQGGGTWEGRSPALAAWVLKETPLVSGRTCLHVRWPLSGVREPDSGLPGVGSGAGGLE